MSYLLRSRPLGELCSFVRNHRTGNRIATSAHLSRFIRDSAGDPSRARPAPLPLCTIASCLCLARPPARHLDLQGRSPTSGPRYPPSADRSPPVAGAAWLSGDVASCSGRLLPLRSLCWRSVSVWMWLGRPGPDEVRVRVAPSKVDAEHTRMYADSVVKLLLSSYK